MMFSWDRAATALLDCFDEFAGRHIRRDRGTQRGRMMLHLTRTPQATEPSAP
jgi:hypothetical protein